MGGSTHQGHPEGWQEGAAPLVSAGASWGFRELCCHGNQLGISAVVRRADREVVRGGGVGCGGCRGETQDAAGFHGASRGSCRSKRAARRDDGRGLPAPEGLPGQEPAASSSPGQDPQRRDGDKGLAREGPGCGGTRCSRGSLEVSAVPGRGRAPCRSVCPHFAPARMPNVGSGGCSWADRSHDPDPPAAVRYWDRCLSLCHLCSLSLMLLGPST